MTRDMAVRTSLLMVDAPPRAEDRGRSAGAFFKRTGKVTLTPHDVELIRDVWHQDPTDPAVLRAFAQSRADTMKDLAR